LRAPALVLLLAVALAGCKPDLGADPWLVDAPRVLAVRATPAEAAPGALVKLEVLAADPGGPVDPASADWTLCLVPRAPTDPGVVSDACLQPVGEGLAPAGTGSPVDVVLPFDACSLFGPDVPPSDPGEPPARPSDPDVTGGYYQPVRVAVAGDDTFELVRVSCNLGSASAEVAAEYQRRYHANQNPELLPLEVSVGGGDPAALDPEQPLEVDAGATVHLVAAWPAESAEPYVQYDLVSRQIVDRRESLRVSWYVSAGTLDLERSGRSEDDPATTAANDYTAPAQAGSAHLWLVLRDSRGGVAYQHHPIAIR
jgi:hypothetical protein